MKIVAKAALGFTAITCLNAMLALGEVPRSNPLRPESAGARRIPKQLCQRRFLTRRVAGK